MFLYEKKKAKRNINRYLKGKQKGGMFMKSQNSSCILETPIGPLRIVASKESILCIEPAGQATVNETQINQIIFDASDRLIKAYEAELEEYFARKRKSFDLPLQLKGTDFQKNVWNRLQQIPYGQTCTYGNLPETAGNKKASRAAGMACHCNQILILIPCHRVIGADGGLTGYAAGIEAKKYLLQMEKEYSSR